ncbi:MAG: thioredoxin domain-containing protein [Proteobacteria bacterium]|nr:thioredoxin domain-containing protein [Pseudomonadota bacterium]
MLHATRRWLGFIAIAAVLAAIATGGPASAQAQAGQASAFTPQQRAEIVQILRDALAHDPSILRDALDTMQAEDARRQEAATRAAIAEHRAALVDPADPVAGNLKGDVTIVEFFDTRCPYCRHLEPTMARFLEGDGKVKLVYKDLPILGPASVLGSRALLAAQRQGGYEKLREAIMASPPDVNMDAIRDLAIAAGLDWARMQRDMADPTIQARLDANTRLARELGIQGTPALVIGDTLIPGAVEVADLQKAVADARATAQN